MDRWSTRMADSLMARKPMLTDKWTYDYGVVFKGMEGIYNLTGDENYFNYILRSMDFFVNEDGSIKMYNPHEYNIDHVNNGKLLPLLYEKTGQAKYRKAADLLMSQLKAHPRTSEGAFWHKHIYPFQVWLDGLYMGSPFYAEYLHELSDFKNFDDVIKQFVICESHTKDAKTGLLYHAWDEKKSMFWCDPHTGLSQNFWGRSMGWFVMALVDVLDYIPSAKKERLMKMLNDTLLPLLKVQDKNSGCWYQVLDMGDKKGNYVEASASCMIAYALAKGISKDYIKGENFDNSLRAAHKGIIEEFITITKEGYVNLNKTCQVAGLGGADMRDGTYAYYISEPIVANDMKGVGAFLNMAAAVEDLVENHGFAL